MYNQMVDIESGFAKALMADSAFLQKIRDAKFDLIFGDVDSLLTNLLVSHLEVPTIMYQNILAPYESNIFFPVTPSITCTLPGVTCHAHVMDFGERVVNFATFLIFDLFMTDYVFNRLTAVAEESNFKLNVPLRDVLKNKVTIINANYVLDMPLATMPHVFPISGLYHKEPSPLTEEFLNIIKSSQPHGVILLSFGTMMPEFDAVKADMFARVLGKLKQSVIWRFTGMF